MIVTMENHWIHAQGSLLARFQPRYNRSQHHVRRALAVATKLLEFLIEIATRIRHSDGRLQYMRIQSVQFGQPCHEHLGQVRVRRRIGGLEGVPKGSAEDMVHHNEWMAEVPNIWLEKNRMRNRIVHGVQMSERTPFPSCVLAPTCVCRIKFEHHRRRTNIVQLGPSDLNGVQGARPSTSQHRRRPEQFRTQRIEVGFQAKF